MNHYSALDMPHPNAFTKPYFFFSHRVGTDVAHVSPSVRDVLGYDPRLIEGVSYRRFIIEEDPINADVPECQQMDLSDGKTLHTLRSVRDSDGHRRVLSVRTAGVSEFPGGPVVRRHSVARDVTVPVQTHLDMVARLRDLDDAAFRMNDQERRIADRILSGKLNRDIAIELGISDRTVERRRATIMKYFGVVTSSELASKLTERNLLRSWQSSGCDSHWQTARNSHVALADFST
jgi:DNA-binding CsgD family transcriptional regulator